MKAQLIYGIHAVSQALQRSPEQIKQLWLSQQRKDEKCQQVIRLAEKVGLKPQFVSSKVLDKMVPARHQGVIIECASAHKNYSENDMADLLAKAGTNALILILDCVEDPHNLGACLRSADAAGVCMVLAPKDRAVGLTATVSKVACGAAENVPFIQVTNLARTLAWLKQQGVWLYGAAGEARASLYQTQFSGINALIMGAEAKGLRRLTREACDQLLKIPMQGQVESLNVSVATGICLFEIRRQQQSNG